MDPRYKDLHKTADNLHFRFHDVLDNPNHPMANVLKHEVKQLVEDIEMNKHPRAIEDRVKVIQQQLQRANREGGMINPNEFNNLHHDYERLRVNVRELPHY